MLRRIIKIDESKCSGCGLCQKLGPTGASTVATHLAGIDYSKWDNSGRCATVWSGIQCIGTFGQVHPLVAQNYGVDAELYCAELAFDALMNAKGADAVYVPLPKFPAVTRDIAVVCDEAVTVGQLEAAIRKGGKALLKEVALFDIYRGVGVPEGKKSMAFALELRADDRTLTDTDSEQVVSKVLEALKTSVGAILR